MQFPVIDGDMIQMVDNDIQQLEPLLAVQLRLFAVRRVVTRQQPQFIRSQNTLRLKDDIDMSQMDWVEGATENSEGFQRAPLTVKIRKKGCSTDKFTSGFRETDLRADVTIAKYNPFLRS